MSIVITKKYGALPTREREILRYAAARCDTAEANELLRSVTEEALPHIQNSVCYIELPLTLSGRVCDFGHFTVESDSLTKNLAGCKKVILFAATVGLGIDRLIRKYSTVSPSRALMLQAYGTECIEVLADTFCLEIEKIYEKTKNRFSIGYGDTPLTAQREIFKILDPYGKIGITLNESMLMTPSKSVTAFVGIEK